MGYLDFLHSDKASQREIAVRLDPVHCRLTASGRSPPLGSQNRTLWIRCLVWVVRFLTQLSDSGRSQYQRLERI